jgi:hypothetical protein
MQMILDFLKKNLTNRQILFAFCFPNICLFERFGCIAVVAEKYTWQIGRLPDWQTS